MNKSIVDREFNLQLEQTSRTVSLVSLIIITRRKQDPRSSVVLIAAVSTLSPFLPWQTQTGSANDANKGGWSLQPAPAPIPSRFSSLSL